MRWCLFMWCIRCGKLQNTIAEERIAPKVTNMRRKIKLELGTKSKINNEVSFEIEQNIKTSLFLL